MIKIRIDKNGRGEPIFKIKLNEETIKDNRLLYRGVLSGKRISGLYNFEIPMKYFLPIYNNLNKDEVILDTRSIYSYLEFSDEIEEKFYYSITATPKYMKLWREENCQNIYKITINKETKELEKRIAFKKINLII
ncbi:hypothetical protein [Clostridium sp.]|uniref:hypothetical protein n=1 Tax=Clostridium sp. TaxID=1506 RepID=UPI002A91F1C9|nr:hypothetical protein [Clostridium sp.]MDY6012075.1 hypothetical protein [Clostridium sp.]